MNTSSYKVSICVPIYGVELYIERCARSLFEQTYENIEYIFVNDCTKDNSVEILKRVLEEYPCRKSQVRIINHKKNRGLAASRNTAVAATTGTFLMHVDSDDFVEKDALTLLVIQQIKNNADIVCANSYKLLSNSKELKLNKRYSNVTAYLKAILSRKEQVCIWGKLIRTSLYKSNNIEAEEGTNMGEDYHTLCRLAYYAKKVDILSKEIYYYDCSNSMSYSNVFSISKHKQSWRSFDIVLDFCKNKERDYCDAVLRGEIRIITSHLIMSQKVRNGSYYYDEAIKRLRTIDKSFWKVEPMTRRLVLYLSFNKCVMNLYIRLSKLIIGVR